MKVIRLKKINKILSFLCVLVILLFPITRINAASYSIAITRYSQEKSNWCWVACAQMCGKYYGNNYTQTKICTYVKGSAVNESASVSEIASAIKYATDKIVACADTVAFDLFVTEIKNEDPIVIGVTWNSGGGHVYTVSGVNEENALTVNSLYLIDPISGRSSKYVSYSNLINGTTLDSGTGKYKKTWVIN